jgi:hypothetical protein
LYICQQLSDDIECQINGAVLICFPLNETRQGKFPVMDKSVKMVLDTIGQRISPIRISAVHICIPDDPWFSVGASIALRAFPKQFRIRTRVHTGKLITLTKKQQQYIVIIISANSSRGNCVCDFSSWETCSKLFDL